MAQVVKRDAAEFAFLGGQSAEYELAEHI